MGRVVFVRVKRGREFTNVGLHEMTDAELAEISKRHDYLEGWRWARNIARELADKAEPPEADSPARMSTSANRSGELAR